MEGNRGMIFFYIFLLITFTSLFICLSSNLSNFLLTPDFFFTRFFQLVPLFSLFEVILFYLSLQSPFAHDLQFSLVLFPFFLLFFFVSTSLFPLFFFCLFCFLLALYSSLFPYSLVLILSLVPVSRYKLRDSGLLCDKPLYWECG